MSNIFFINIFLSNKS